MLRRAWHAGVLALLFPAWTAAQGRDTKVYYDDSFAFGSRPLLRLESRYFEILSTPEDEDAEGELLRHWAPRLDRFFDNVAGNLCLTPQEVCRFLLHPDFFVQIDRLALEGHLGADAVRTIEAGVLSHGGAGETPVRLAFASPCGGAGDDRARRYGLHAVLEGDSVVVTLPERRERRLQRCLLYRTLADFIASPLAPAIPEGVLGFVPRHDPDRPVVVYASLGESKLNRTAQHEIAHAVVEAIAVYQRRLSVTRALNAEPDTAQAKPWKPQSGGFAAITHENFAEYLAFPRGRMDPVLRAALVEMVGENRIDGLAAMSVGARTLASSYIEGPARLHFLAETFGDELPKRLLLGYLTGSLGFLDTLEELTGRSVSQLEELYRRWLRRRFWDEYLATDVPDTLGETLATGLAGVRRDGILLVQRFRSGRQEIVLQWPRRRYERKASERVLVRDLDGAERLPLFSTADLRSGWVAASVRFRNQESLFLHEIATGRSRIRELSEIAGVREIRDPRLSPDGRTVVFRLVNRGGANAIALYERDGDRIRILVPWTWAEVAHPSFRQDGARVLYSSTATSDGTADLFDIDLVTGATRNLTASAGTHEFEPLDVHGHLVTLAEIDRRLVPAVVRGGAPQALLELPFPTERLQAGDSTLVLVATSLRHHENPAGRALWAFPLRRLGLDAAPSAVLQAAADARAGTAADVAGRTAADSTSEVAPRPAPPLAIGAAAAIDLAAGEAVSSLVPPAPVTLYRQRWRLMPLGLNLSSGVQSARGVSVAGFETEMQDQSVVVAAGQSGTFDRFAMLQYRNRVARTHWQVSGFHRSVIRSRYTLDSLQTVDRRESEQGLLLSAQYHKSLATRLGFGLSVARRNDTSGRVVARQDEFVTPPPGAPLLGLQLPGPNPASWNVAVAGLPRLSLLRDRSPAALAAWSDAVQQNTARQEEFLPTSEYVRAAATLGAGLSRDTRVWSDYRGPDSGSLLVVDLSAGAHAPGTRAAVGQASDGSRESIGTGLERLAAGWLFLTHRRCSFVDLAFRCRGLLNSGPQAITYGLGGIYSVAGYRRAAVRSERIAWANAEARVPLWDYSTWRLPWRPLVFPAADGFVYADAGVAGGSEPLSAYGIGLRLRLGFLAFEWRRSLRSGLAHQSGLSIVW